MFKHLHHKNVSGQKVRWLTYPKAAFSRLEERQLGPFGEEQIVFKTMYSGISRGTESLVFNGNIPPEQHQVMRCPHQTGEFSFPVSYGYSCVGEVVDFGSKVEGISCGDIIFVLHPHAEFGVVDATMVNKLPAELPPARAILSANMETALNAIWDSGVSKGSSCAVIGAGVVGLLTARLALDESGIKPLVIDIDPAKRDAVERLGLEFALADEVCGEFDTVFHASATSGGLQQAIELCSFEGQVVEMSWYGNKVVNLELGGAFHSKRLRIVSSQVGHVSPLMRDKLSHADRMQMAMTRLCDSDFDCLLEPAVAFDDLPEHLPRVFSNDNRGLCQLVRY